MIAAAGAQIWLRNFFSRIGRQHGVKGDLKGVIQRFALIGFSGGGKLALVLRTPDVFAGLHGVTQA